MGKHRARIPSAAASAKTQPKALSILESEPGFCLAAFCSCERTSIPLSKAGQAFARKRPMVVPDFGTLLLFVVLLRLSLFRGVVRKFCRLGLDGLSFLMKACDSTG